METFASLREHRIIRLNENKDRFIQKNTLLTDEQKAEVLDFFHSHANLEAKVNNGNWSYNIPYEEFKKVMASVDTGEKRLKKQTKELRKQKGLEGLTEGTDYTVFKDTPEYTAYRPLTHKGMRVIASNMVEPKLWCESTMMEWSPKEILPNGEPMKDGYYPGAKWCVAMETDEHWERYTKGGNNFIVVCSKNPKMVEELKKICLVYDGWDLSEELSVTASDASLKDVESDYVETAIHDMDTILHGEGSNFVLGEIQRCYHPDEGVYRLSNRVIPSRKFLKLGKLDHPVVWEGSFKVPEDATSLEGCPDEVTGDFACDWGTSLTSLEGAPEKVGGSFYCRFCYSLESLEGAPKYVGQDFHCSDCKNLISLKGAPNSVGRNFDCSDCKNLTSLEGAPESVGGDFYCVRCHILKSLEGAPRQVGGSLNCHHCPITSLKGAPEYVGGGFYCEHCNSLTSLEGAPKDVEGDFSCVGCKSLTSLEGAPKKIEGSFRCDSCDSLTSLEGAPEYVGGRFSCSECSNLTSLEGAP